MANKSFHNFLSDLRVELMDEFDKNIERKAFLDHLWKDATLPNRIGSNMLRPGSSHRC